MAAKRTARKTAKKQPSKTLMGMISKYNKENEAKNRILMKKRKEIITRAKKEGFTVNMR